MVKSPSLNGYFLDQPCAPNLIRPEMSEWKKQTDASTREWRESVQQVWLAFGEEFDDTEGDDDDDDDDDGPRECNYDDVDHNH